jgi:hypothetical protein
MEVINFYFVDNEVEDFCRRKVVDYAFDFSSMLSVIIGCTTSAPDGSSPRGYSRNFSGIGSRYIVVLTLLLRYSWHNCA